MNIAGSYVLITGAAGSLGSVVSRYLHEKGARLCLVDSRKGALADLDIPEAVRLECDLTQPQAVFAMVDQLRQSGSLPNVLVNNAGLIHSEPLVNLFKRPDSKHDLDNWQRVIDVNLNAVFYMGAAMAEAWVKKRMPGLIINISSVSAQGNMGQSAYAATKAAVEALTKTWSKELGMLKIRCACVAPGFMDAPSTAQSMSEAHLDKWKKSVPLNRLGKPDELAAAIAFIIENDYFNGKVLPLDGGLTI